MQYVVFDLETTCWSSDYAPADFREEREIIEIAAIALDQFGNQIDQFQRLVRPEIHPILSRYCTQLTGITQEDVDSAAVFKDCFMEFEQFLLQLDYSYTFVAWGSDDGPILDRACRLARFDPIVDHNYLDVKSAWHTITNRGKRIGLLKALRQERIEFEGEHHRAFPDAYNLTKLFRKYLGEWPI